MSIRAVDAVLRSTGTRGNARCVLIALADYADDDGVCWPSVANVAAKANVCERTAQSTIARLVRDGELVVEPSGGPRRTNRYTLACVAAGGVQVLRGASSAGVQIVAPEPSYSSSFPNGQEEGRAIEPPATATEPKPVVVAPPPSPRARGAFTARVKPRLVELLAGGEAALATNARTGADLAWVGRCLAMLGRWTGDDADAALAWLDWWRRSDEWRFRGGKPHAWPGAMAAARDVFNDRPVERRRGAVNLDRR